LKGPRAIPAALDQQETEVEERCKGLN
jgi:hypothetical protein